MFFVSWLTPNYNMRSDFISAKYYSKWSLISNIVIDILFILQIVTVVLLCVFLIPSSGSLTGSSFADSRILTNDQSLQLVDLTDLHFKFYTKVVKMDLIQVFFIQDVNGVHGTLTIIKGRNSNIFGGYTFADWSGEQLFKYDSTAFLFSLVNI